MAPWYRGTSGDAYELYGSPRHIKDRGSLVGNGYDLSDPDLVIAALLDGERPSAESGGSVATVLSWNVWQMDGTDLTVPFSCEMRCGPDPAGMMIQTDTILRYFRHPYVMGSVTPNHQGY